MSKLKTQEVLQEIKQDMLRNNKVHLPYILWELKNGKTGAFVIPAEIVNIESEMQQEMVLAVMAKRACEMTNKENSPLKQVVMLATVKMSILKAEEEYPENRIEYIKNSKNARKAILTIIADVDPPTEENNHEPSMKISADTTEIIMYGGKLDLGPTQKVKENVDPGLISPFILGFEAVRLKDSDEFTYNLLNTMESAIGFRLTDLANGQSFDNT